LINLFSKYGLFCIIALFFPLKVGSIIFTGLGGGQFPPITLIMYFFSFSMFFYWFLTYQLANLVNKDIIFPLLVKSTYLLIVSTYVFTFFYFQDGYESFISRYVGFIFSFISYLVLGVLLYRFYLNRGVRLTFYIWLLSIIPILMIGDLTDVTINYRLLFGEKGYDYLLVGDVVVLLSFLLLLKLPENKKFYFIIIFIVTLFILFKNGSRTSFYAFTISLFLSAILIYRSKALLLFAFSSALIFITIYSLNIDMSLLTESRVFMLISSESSSSLGVREELHQYGLERIINSPLLGDMLGQINHPIAVSPFGSYMHNILSHYSQFGVVPFSLYVISWGFIYVAFFERLSSFSNKEKLVILSIIFYSSVSLTFSRAFVHTIYEAFWIFTLLLITRDRAKLK